MMPKNPKSSRIAELQIRRSSFQRFILISFLILMVIISVVFSFIISRQVTMAFSGVSGRLLPDIFKQARASNVSQDTLEDALPGDSRAAVDPAIQALSSNLTPWDGAGRVTVLVMGLDYRDWEAGDESARSDTMILMTLDPLTKTAGILSVPRDMWVQIPGFKHGKINTAHYLGDAYQLPGGGPALAVKTVEQFIGVPINYYAVIDFDAFVRFIDELGGIKIDVPEKITIDLLGGGPETKKTLYPGVQVLPGEWALAYARNRSTENGDFDRARRQQQVILGMRERILSLDMLPTLISKAPTLYRELSSGINTNLSLEQAIKLALLAQEVPDQAITRGVLDNDYIIFGRSPDNLSILIPLPDKVRLLRDQIFASSSGLSPETPGDAQQRMQAEAAKLALYNASAADSGFTNRTAEYLRNLGVNISAQGESGEQRAQTRIIDRTGNPYLINYLVDLMGISPSNIYSNFDPTSAVDVEVYLGNDWANNNPIP